MSQLGSFKKNTILKSTIGEFCFRVIKMVCDGNALMKFLDSFQNHSNGACIGPEMDVDYCIMCWLLKRTHRSPCLKGWHFRVHS